MESRTVSPSKAMVQSTRRMSSLAIILPLFSRFFALCALGQSYRFQGGLSMQFSFSNQIIFCAARDAKKTAENERRFRQFFHVFMRSANAGKYFSTNSGVFGPEALSVEIFECPGGGVKDEPQPPRSRAPAPFRVVGAVVLFAAVFPVAKQRTPSMAELRADLVRAPGDRGGTPQA